jgi:hypothetical protein
MNKQLVLGFLFFLFFSCEESEFISEDFKDRIEIDFSQKLSNVKLSEISAKNSRLIALETSPKSIVARVDKVLVTDDYIFILDMLVSRTIFMFSKNGEFIRKIGDFGLGPEEIEGPIDFFIDDSKLYILDMGIRVKVFDLEGKFLESDNVLSLGAIKFQKVANSDIFCFVSGMDDYNLKVTDKNFKIISSYFPYQNPYYDAGIVNPIYKSQIDGSLIFRRNLNDTLFRIDNNGIKSPYRYFDFGSKSVINSGLDPIKDVGDLFWSKLVPYSMIWYYYESNSHGLLGFRLDDELWFYIHSKNSSKVSHLIKRSLLINDLTFEQESYPIAVDGDYIVFLVESPNYIRGLSQSDNEVENYFFEKEDLKTIDYESNPLLLFVKFNF